MKIVLIIVVILIILLIFIPIRVYINYGISSKKINSNRKSSDVEEDPDNYLLLKIFYYIPILKMNMKKKNKKDKINEEGSNDINNKDTNIRQNSKEINENNSDTSNYKYIFDGVYGIFREALGYYKLVKSRLSRKEIEEILRSLSYERFYLDFGINLSNPIINSYTAVTINTILCMYINKNIEKFDLRHLYYKVYTSNELYKLNFNSILKFRITNNIFVSLKIFYILLKIKYLSRKVEDKDGRTSNRKSDDDFNDITRKYD
ncbi:MAG: hypothetical protein N2749_01570 [Clostridia bacterium]|nr:hypothetical protein [Clostridia bacterium]